MFAVIKTGGKQYRVAADDVLKIEKVDGQIGDIVTIGHVLAHGADNDSTFGAPFVDGASVAAEILEQGKAKTVIAFKKRRRQNSRRTRGHRQLLTTVRISEILLDGAKPSKKATGAAPKAGKAAKAEVAAEGAAAEPHVEVSATPPMSKPATLFTAPDGDGDNLVVIKGIGKVAAGQLKEQGITTFAQLAALTDEDIEKIDANMPFSTDQIRDWQGQAKDLAK